MIFFAFTSLEVQTRLNRLKEIDAAIPGPYILITHNSDYGASDEIHQFVEGLPKIVHWYGQNLESGGIRTTVPIGLENRRWGKMRPEYYSRALGTRKESMAVASFRPRNPERRALLEMLRTTRTADWLDIPRFGYDRVDPSVPKHEAWLRKQAGYKFAISPVGHGIDCHRTWEMIAIGVVPVMRTTIIDSVFSSLRAEGAVLIVDQWGDLNRTLLEDHWRRFGRGLVQRQENWLRRPDNAGLARHWVHRLSLHSEDRPPRPHEAVVKGGFADEMRRLLQGRIHFRTYGNDKYAGAKKRIVEEAVDTGWFATAGALGPEDLPGGFRDRYGEILALRRGGGYWIWKFHVIERAMEMMREGDFLVYLDAGSQFNKGGEKRFYEYIRMLNQTRETDMLGFQLPGIEHRWTTPRLFRAMNVSDQGQAAITHTGQLESGTMIFRKGPVYRRWIKRCWAVIDMDPWMITDKYNEETKAVDPSFKENRHDQSIMSVTRKMLGCVRVDGSESKNAQPDKPFHVKRCKRISCKE